MANPAYSESDLKHHVKDSGAKACIFGEAGHDMATKVLDELNFPASHRFALSKKDLKGVKSIFSLIGSQKHTPRRLTEEETHKTAFMCYSSGTTGKPKGVKTSHSNLWHTAHQVQASEPMTGKQGELENHLDFNLE